MAKYYEVHEDTQALFDKFLEKIDNLREVNVKILAQNKLKEITKVSKANDLVKHMTNEDIVIILNEDIFELLEPNQKSIIIEECLAQVYFDAEKGKVVLIKPDISAGFSGVMSKYGLETYIQTKQLLKELFSKEAAEEAEQNQ